MSGRYVVRNNQGIGERRYLKRDGTYGLLEQAHIFDNYNLASAEADNAIYNSEPVLLWKEKGLDAPEPEDVEALKREWTKDPAWDLYTTKWFEPYAAELEQFEKQYWADAEDKRETARVAELREKWLPIFASSAMNGVLSRQTEIPSITNDSELARAVFIVAEAMVQELAKRTNKGDC